MLQGSSSRTGASPQVRILPEALGWAGRLLPGVQGGDGAGIEADGRASQNGPAEGARGPTKRTREEARRCAKAGGRKGSRYPENAPRELLWDWGKEGGG